MYQFNPERAVIGCVTWIENWFRAHGSSNSKAVLEITQERDSIVAANLLIEALGKDRVVGVWMRNSEEYDINVVYNIAVKHLGIRCFPINMMSEFESIISQLDHSVALSYQDEYELTKQSRTDLISRLKMSALYTVAQSINGKVCRSCNYSNEYIGRYTRWGDCAGDFNPLGSFTHTEVKAISEYLKIPEDIIIETEATDSYIEDEILDKYIREGVKPDEETKCLIDSLHNYNLFKLKPIDWYQYIQPK